MLLALTLAGIGQIVNNKVIVKYIQVWKFLVVWTSAFSRFSAESLATQANIFKHRLLEVAVRRRQKKGYDRH